MSLYRAVYKCPLCGALLTTGKPAEVSPDMLPELLGRFVKGQRFAGNPYLNQPPAQIAHKCADGSAGLAQFAGFQIVNQP